MKLAVSQAVSPLVIVNPKQQQEYSGNDDGDNNNSRPTIQPAFWTSLSNWYQ